MDIGLQLALSTVRIETSKPSLGTGFLYTEPSEVADHSINLVITNKHVVKNTDWGRIVFHLDDPTLDFAVPHPESKGVLFKNWQSRWFDHPDDDIDLCCMPIGDVSAGLIQQGHKLFEVCFGPQHLPTDQELLEFATICEVHMPGYPTGLWDSAHNLPLIRKGITATHPGINYQGRREFAVDMACFKGSSGSPVVIIDHSNIDDTFGKLLGILYFGPHFNAVGEIIIPSASSAGGQLETTTGVPMHLGYVIKGSTVREMLDAMMLAAKDPDDIRFNLNH